MMAKVREVGRALRLKLPNRGEFRLGKMNPCEIKGFNTPCFCLFLEVRKFHFVQSGLSELIVSVPHFSRFEIMEAASIIHTWAPRIRNSPILKLRIPYKLSDFTKGVHDTLSLYQNHSSSRISHTPRSYS